jgi:hypothetical protein
MARKIDLTEQKAKNSPQGGVLVGKRNGQTIIYDDGKVGGWFVGKTHKEGGIKGIDKTSGQPIEVQTGEVIITAPALADQTTREFEGKMMTNREILSKINHDAGGVAFAEDGMEVSNKILCKGGTYNYGGKMMSDKDIVDEINKCGCEHEDEKFNYGGKVKKHLSEGMSLEDIAKLHNVLIEDLDEQVKIGMKDESIHAGNYKDHFNIVKDHLVESPTFYTDEQKAQGEFKNGGEFKKYHKDHESLVRDAKSGNTPARDLNNYNDLLDVQADGKVGGDSGIDMDGAFVGVGDGNGGADATGGVGVFANGGTFTSNSQDKIVKGVEVTNYNSGGLKEIAYNPNELLNIFKNFHKKIGFIDTHFFVTPFNNSGNKFKELGVEIGGGDFQQIIPEKISEHKLFKYLKGKYGGLDWSNFTKQSSNYANGGSVNFWEKEDITIVNGDYLKRAEIVPSYKDDTMQGKYFVVFRNELGKIASYKDNFETYDSALKFAKENVNEIKNYADGGDVKPYDANMEGDSANMVFDLGGNTGKPNVDKIVIYNSSMQLKDLLDKEYYNYKDFLRDVREEFDKNNNESSWIDIKVNNDKDYAFIKFSLARNTNSNFNLLTGTPKDFFKQIQKAKSVLANNYDWSNFFNGSNKPITNSNQSIDLSNTKIWIGDNPDLSRRVQEKAFELGWKWVSGKSIQNLDKNSILFWNDKDITSDKYKNKYYFDTSNVDMKEITEADLFGTTSQNKPTTSNNNTITDLNNTWININGDIELAKRVVKKAEELGWNDSNGINNKIDYNYFINNIWFSSDKYIGWDNNSGKEITEADLFGTTLQNKPTTSAPIITDLRNKKIWIGDNPELSERIQKRAFELGWDWYDKIKTIRNTNAFALYFDNQKKITIDGLIGNKSKMYFDTSLDDEITEADLFGTGTQTPISTTNQNVTNQPKNEYTADLDKLVVKDSDSLNKINTEKDRNDLEKFKKLLPAFQESKFSVEKATILKEINRLHKKITYEGFIKPNEENSIKFKLFTPQGLLEYYYNQSTQSPVAPLEPACELPTPNGEKSKLPLNAYLNVRTPQFKKWFGDWELAYETDNYINCSKMIDEETKEPKIFYHGVRKYVPNFGQFSNMGQGVVRPYGSFEPPSAFPASYFADNEDYAKFYGGDAPNMPKPSEDYEPFIYKVFLSVKNPIDLLPLGFESSYKDVLDYLLIAYGIKIQPSSNVLNIIRNDMKSKNPVWVYIRNDISLIETIKDYGYDALIQIGDIPTFNDNGEVIDDRSKFIKEEEYLTFYPTQVKSATVKKSFYFDFFNDIRFNKGGYVRI